MYRNIPNWLTYSRIAVIPLVVATFYIDGKWGYWLPAFLFLYACITDYLDGYLARFWQVTSAIGRFLDPVADKLLVATALMLLVSTDRAPIVPAIAILCREMLVSGLREFLADLRISVPVTTVAKYKTAAQMAAIFALLLGNGFAYFFTDLAPTPDSAAQIYANIWIIIGKTLLWGAAAITVFTGYVYLREGVKHM